MAAALVTGASTGIGRELALLCARDGLDLCLIARSKDALESLAEAIRAETGRTVITLPRDLSVPGAAVEIFDAVRRSGLEIEVLINNAGVGLLGRLWEQDAERARQMVFLNVAAVTDLTRLFLPAMIERRRGRILNVASTAAFQPGPLMAIYYATKSYVLSFSEAVHNEVKDFGVTVTCLCPGPTKSEFAVRAGMTQTKLFKGASVMAAGAVARLGYQAMKRGKPLIITGRLNALMAFLTRFASLQLTASMARKFQQQPN